LLDKIHFHHAAADAARELATGRDRHLVTGTARAAARTVSDNEQHHGLTAFQTLADKLPEFKFSVHERYINAEMEMAN
jgi:hypothetical protein